MKMSVESIIAIITLIVTVLGTIRFREWLRRPKLEIEIDINHERDFQLSQQLIGLRQQRVVSIRGRVINTGKTSAKNVEVALTGLTHRINGKNQIIPNYSPKNLKWSHLFNEELKPINPKDVSPYLPYLSPGISKHFILSVIVESDYKGFLTPDWIDRWSCGINQIRTEYLFEISASAANVSTCKTQKFQLTFNKSFWDPPTGDIRLSDYFEISKI